MKKRFLVGVIFFSVILSCNNPSGKMFVASSYPDTVINPFILENGVLVTSKNVWETKRKPDIMMLFEEHVYGKTPGTCDSVSSEMVSSKLVFSDKAKMEQVTLTIYENGKTLDLNLLQYIPIGEKKRYPCFIGLNFWGNQNTTEDASVRVTDKWMLDYEIKGIVDHYATDSSRAVNKRRWPAEMIIDAGFALITCHSADIDTDNDLEDWTDGAHPLFYREGQEKPDSAEWGTIGAWAWGMSRILDYAIAHNNIDGDKVIATGHSRLGKTSLWAGAQDERFAGVVSNNSGCGGSAYAKRVKGETVKMINDVFPHWFNDNFTKYNNNEAELPVDQHLLMATIAPRPLYVGSATLDKWADPEGEFFSAMMADTVFRFLTGEGLNTDTLPAPNTPVIGRLGYHLREGKHDIVAWDWEQYLKWADRYLVDQ
jgi:hypothetical protein